MKFKSIKQLIYYALMLLLLPALAISQTETYKFERIIPQLQQMWYFITPAGVAVDSKGFVYVADMNSHCIKKFTPDGFFVTQWGTFGRAEDEPPDSQRIIFGQPRKIAVYKNSDGKDYIYVVDTSNHRIQKFTSTGEHLVSWGEGKSDEDGKFVSPKGIAVDSKNGFVYVADSSNHRIQQFDLNGNFLEKWGSYGSENGNFDSPADIAVDSQSNFYIADSGNHRIQKFDSSGAFIREWGKEGSDEGEFNTPYGLATDDDDMIYVADLNNNRIQKFDSNGNFKAKWGDIGTGNQELNAPYDLVVGNNDTVYVADSKNSRILRIDVFDSEGAADAWGIEGSKDGEFRVPTSIVCDSNDFIYVADTDKHCIQKFNSNGSHIKTWGRFGSGEGEFNRLGGLGIDSNGFIYITDSNNNRVQKFTTDGTFKKQWGSLGNENGEFITPSGIAVDSNNFIYVADSINNRIQKFTSEGEFIGKWGSFGVGTGKFSIPIGIAIDSDNFIYVADSKNFRIQKFTEGGIFVTALKNFSFLNPDFYTPTGIEFDEAGFLYIVDSAKGRILKIDPSNPHIISAEIGREGSNLGELQYPSDVCITSNGRMYVADTGNHRVQIFKPALFGKKTKAIIVAGGWPDDDIWDGIQFSANFAYYTLNSQGLMDEDIDYLSSNTYAYRADGVANCVNLENIISTYKIGLTEESLNNLLNYLVILNVSQDVRIKLEELKNKEYENTDDFIYDLEVTIGKEQADQYKSVILGYAVEADDVILYLVDHGGKNFFQINEDQYLYASLTDDVSEIACSYDLKWWINEIQQKITGKIIIIYDACESGTFLPELKSDSDKERIIITGTSEGESAWFVNDGVISFSFYFWTQIFKGASVKEAFDSASDTISFTQKGQNPLFDYNGSEDPQNIYIGTNLSRNEEAPLIEEQIGNQGDEIRLYAYGVTDKDGVDKVWAEIIPPDYNPESSENPLADLPSVDFLYVGNDQYESSYTFDKKGTYHILIYAKDKNGNISALKTTKVTISLNQKAIIAGGNPSMSDLSWTVIEDKIKWTYQVLRYQEYLDKDIYVMTPNMINIPDGDVIWVQSSRDNLKEAFNWSSDADDVILYMLGNADEEIFHLNHTETLLASELDQWLDDLQGNMEGIVTVIYDAHYSGSFIPFLLPPEGKQRIVITSTNKEQRAYFIGETGDISFSQYFWSEVWKGEDVGHCIINTKVSLSNSSQRPQIDDNGNGVSNEQTFEVADGETARNYYIGVGKKAAAPSPEIKIITPAQTLYKTSSITLWAKVNLLNDMDIIKALIYTPDGNYSSTELVYNVDKKQYETTYDGFSECGNHRVMIYAKNQDGITSLPMFTSIQKCCDSNIEVDIDWNGDITLVDAIAVLKILSGMSLCANENPTVNNDYKIGLEDAVYILQYLAGLR
ncbi:MAG: 6-bladed beta-propeller [Desulfobacterales bacterium]|nr:6-bladed beta-propeller [Desulfobacterales bacterium]